MSRPPLGRHLARTVFVATMLMSLSVGIVACDGGSATTTSTAGAGTTIATGPTTTLPTAYATPESNALARELKRTVQLAAILGQKLQDQGATANDPRIALVWALRARGQAVTARKALLEKQPELADNAAKELRIQLVRAGAIADSSLAGELAQALALMATMGQPSSDPAAASLALDGIIKQLEPVIAQVQAVVDGGSPTTTGGG